ncbi:MAG: polysaccharide deacetylase [Chromatiales bacterium]|nr:polysaccharide deacetylase [Gammaproteobacteria bacterium]MCP5351676.1 polysaccharide deacetylase [Chromatiales bacterium]
MLNVFLTFDTEVWCGGWDNLDQRFPDAFRRYVYGPTPAGDGALPLIKRVLGDHGLTGVFFVEPLFSKRFGLAPLTEMVGLIRDGGHEVQVHLHTEWVDETDPPLLSGISRKHQHLTMFDREQQAALIGIGVEQLRAAGVDRLRAFRAGNYAINEHTAAAVRAAGLDIDSSYNPASGFGGHFSTGGAPRLQAFETDGVLEYPVSVFSERDGGLHALQVTSCSWAEMRHALRAARDLGWESVNIVAHNFELMNRAKTRIDPIVLKRFEKLAEFLGKHPDEYRVQGFNTLAARAFPGTARPIAGSATRRAGRLAGQLTRRLYGA